MAIQKPFAVIPLDLGTIATGNEKSNRLASHVNEFKNPGMVWESTGASSVWIRGDFGSAQEVDFIALLGTNATATTTFRLRLGDDQTEVDGTADYDSGAELIINPAITTTDGIYHSHFELPSTQTERWWRIDIGSHTGDFRCMAVVLGKRVNFADFYNGDGGVEFGFQDLSDLSLGGYGVSEEVEGIMLRTLRMNFGWMSEADRFSNFSPLVKALGKRGVAHWCFDPEATTKRQDKTYFGWLTELPSFRPSTFKQDRWQAPFNITSMI